MPENNIRIIGNSFGSLNGRPVTEFVITNSNGLQAGIINYGGIITKIIVPDRNGVLGDVVTGYETFEGFLQSGNPYFGAIIGRCANRMAKGKFLLNGKEYQLSKNAGNNSLHGGIKGFDKVIWESEVIPGKGVRLSYLSKDGEEGYPGNLNVAVVFSLTDQNEFCLEYSATTDKATPVNLTSHPYFNLSAWKNAKILSHQLQIKATHFTVTDDSLVPTGELRSVAGGPLDFTVEKPIGRDIAMLNGGYDNNYVLDKTGEGLELAAIVTDQETGRKMEVLTTEPGLQLYTTNSIDEDLLYTKGAVKYEKHCAFCLEAQHYPDSPNQASFPTTILNPGEVYRQTTSYKFSVVS
ncbi:MAG: galactose mutarotase [Chitinophagaceae bacterium]|nr:galactose mutarotase [Chitinophagaceae bacterium]